MNLNPGSSARFPLNNKGQFPTASQLENILNTEAHGDGRRARAILEALYIKHKDELGKIGAEELNALADIYSVRGMEHLGKIFHQTAINKNAHPDIIKIRDSAVGPIGGFIVTLRSAKDLVLSAKDIAAIVVTYASKITEAIFEVRPSQPVPKWSANSFDITSPSRPYVVVFQIFETKGEIHVAPRTLLEGHEKFILPSVRAELSNFVSDE